MTFKRSLVFLCSLALLLVVTSGPVHAGTQSARAAAPYHKCGNFRFRGKHALFARHYPCSRARRKARFVLAHRHAPRHWKCSLAELAHGFAACHRDVHSWEFVPA